MRTIAHISDLHFGQENKVLESALLQDLIRMDPAVVAISGDLTQRARTNEFEAAAEFLNRLPFPYLVVPGNHDIPLFDVIRRFASPLDRYKKHISSDLNPVYEDQEMLMLGINTSRSLTFKDGRISEQQIELIRNTFCSSDHPFRILVTHHPFVPPRGERYAKLVGRGAEALQAMENCGVDLLLSGHFHLGYHGDVRHHYRRIKRSILIVQAGTAISRRLRGEENSYNEIRIEPAKVTLQPRSWDGQKFVPAGDTTFVKQNDEWIKL
jgi:3',5'-cyclic AMP phosphodiesterase CpdA